MTSQPSIPRCTPVVAAYLMHRIDDPIDAWIATNGFVLRINQDNLEVLVGRVLINPIGVEYT